MSHDDRRDVNSKPIHSGNYDSMAYSAIIDELNLCKSPIDAKEQTKKVQEIDKLKKEESFAKRHPGVIKLLVAASVLLVVGILVLYALNSAKSASNSKTATGSKLGDKAIKTMGTLAVVGGSLGLVGGAVWGARELSQDSSTGAMIDKYRKTSMQQSINGSTNVAEITNDNAIKLAKDLGKHQRNIADSRAKNIARRIQVEPFLTEGSKTEQFFGNNYKELNVDTPKFSIKTINEGKNNGVGLYQ